MSVDIVFDAAEHVTIVTLTPRKMLLISPASMDLIGKIDSLHEARRAAKFGKYTAAIIGFGVLWLSLRPPIHIIGLVTGCIFIAAAAGIHLMSRFAACFMFLFYALIFVVSLQSRGPSRMALGFSILVAFSYS